MTTGTNSRPTATDAWRQHNLEQLQQFQSLTLREKLTAVQGMADVVRRLSQLRATGKLIAPDQTT